VPDDLPLDAQAGRVTTPMAAPPPTALPAPPPAAPPAAPPRDAGAGAGCADIVQDAWSVRPWRWDAFNAVIFTVVLVVLWFGTTSTQRLVAITAMAAMVPWYALAGRPIWTRGAGSPRRAVVYIAGLFILFAFAQSQDPNAWFLAFLFCPQFFHVISPRLAMAAAIAFNVLAWLLLVYRVRDLAAAVVSLAIAAAGCGFSIVYGGWVTRIINQSRERAEIINQLEATRAELAGANHEAGMLAERQRLAGDIHDTIAQGFTSIVMLLQAAEAEIGLDQAAARRHMRLAAQTARENLTEARTLLAALAPAQLDGGKLDDALRRLAGQAAEQSGTVAEFEVGGSTRPLPTGTQVVLLRVCQEALANVRKHAHAHRAWVHLSYGPADVRLEVRDDGAGFDPAQTNGGYGLRGMRARVGEVGGSFTVRSAPGEGTSVNVEVPA
jgi:signal transduction histidine kinase